MSKVISLSRPSSNYDTINISFLYKEQRNVKNGGNREKRSFFMSVVLYNVMVFVSYWPINYFEFALIIRTIHITPLSKNFGICTMKILCYFRKKYAYKEVIFNFS